MSNRSKRMKRMDRAAYADARASRDRKARMEAAFFQRCLWCKMKRTCGKRETERCRAEVRQRITGGEE